MSKRHYLFMLKSLILLSPLPFGCVGRIWSPLFYLVLVIVSFLAFSFITLPGKKDVFLDEKKVRFIVYVLFGFILFQVLPLPRFLLGVLSPRTLEIMDVMKSSPPSFQSVSVLPAETLGFGMRLFALVLFLFVFLRIKLEKKEMVSLIHTIILSGAFQVILGILKLFQGNTFFYLFFHPDPEPGSHLTGTIVNPDHVSFYLEMIFPLAAALLLAKLVFINPGASFREKWSAFLADKRPAVLYTSAIVLSAAGILLTGSGTGKIVLFLSLFLLGSFAFYFSEPRHLRRRVRVVFALIITAIILIGLQYNLATVMEPGYGNMDYFTCWSNTTKLFSGFPLLGAGFGSFKYIYFLYDTESSGWITHTHNDWLETFSEGGLVGGFLFFLAIGWVLVSLYRSWLPRRNPLVKAVGLGTLAACFSAAFHSFSGFAMRIPAISFLFVLIMGLGIKIVTYKMESENEN
jgi:O-antigen ligase